jgi:hypothetical protein
MIITEVKIIDDEIIENEIIIENEKKIEKKIEKTNL